MAQLKPLSPEQMCWSMLKVTGVYDRTRAAQEAELNKAKPLAGAAANDPAARRLAARSRSSRRTLTSSSRNLRAFITVYAAGAGQPQNDFFATADQALFVCQRRVDQRLDRARPAGMSPSAWSARTTPARRPRTCT